MIQVSYPNDIHYNFNIAPKATPRRAIIPDNVINKRNVWFFKSLLNVCWSDVDVFVIVSIFLPLY